MSRIYVEKNIPLIYIEGITEAKDSQNSFAKGATLKELPKSGKHGKMVPIVGWC